MKKILVTGGAGFIGSNFVRDFVRKHPEIHLINYDFLTYAGNLESLRDIESEPNYSFIKADICDEQSVLKALERVDSVINFAAESHVDRSIHEPAQFIKTNVLGTQTFLHASKAMGIERFIQVSTDEVYGSLGDTGYFTEETPITPNSPYSASKASADLLARAYYETFKFPVIITRCSNNYGPYQFPEKLIPLMIMNALQDKPLPVYGDGLNVRDWLYVDDHCDAIETVLFNGKDGEVYNIGGNNEWKNIDIVRLILKELGKPESLINFVKDRPGHDRRYAIDASKIKNTLGWEPKIQFPEGIKKTIKWYLENKGWLKSVVSGEYMRFYERNYSGR